MKKIWIFSVLLLCGLSLFAQTPKYTTERMADGNLAYICPSENDALLLLSGKYKLPDTYWIAVLLKGIYLEDAPFPGLPPLLKGTKLVGDGNNKGVLGGASPNYYNLNRNTEYYVLWKRELNTTLTQMAQLPGGSGEKVYSSMVQVIADANFNPLTPVKR